MFRYLFHANIQYLFSFITQRMFVIPTHLLPSQFWRCRNTWMLEMGKRQQSLVESDAISFPPSRTPQRAQPPPPALTGIISSPPFSLPWLPWKQSAMLGHLLTWMLCMTEREGPGVPEGNSRGTREGVKWKRGPSEM